MAWSGGVFTRTNGVYSGATVWASDKAALINIVATRHDTHDQDMAQGINACLLKDGTNSPSATINWNAQKITNLAPGTNPSDAVRFDQLPAGSGYQPLDAGLTSISGLTTAADKALYTTALDVYATYTLTAGGRALAGVAGTAGTFPFFSASNTVTLGTITTAGRALLDDADAATQRTTLGLGGMATQEATAVAITGGSAHGIVLSELKQDKTAAASTTIDLSLGMVVALSQAVSITTLAFSNVPTSGKTATVTLIRTKDATATARPITWPASVKWSGGAPTLTSTASCVDIIQLVTHNGGTTWYATASLNFA